MDDLSEKRRLSLGGRSSPDERSLDNGPLDKSQEDGTSHVVEQNQDTVPATASSGKDDIEAQVPDTDAASIISSPVKVPRAQRRGLLATLTILAEVEEPKNYPRRTKWYITCVIALAAAAAPLGSTIFFRKAANCSHPDYLKLTLSSISWSSS